MLRLATHDSVTNLAMLAVLEVDRDVRDAASAVLDHEEVALLKTGGGLALHLMLHLRRIHRGVDGVRVGGVGKVVNIISCSAEDFDKMEMVTIQTLLLEKITKHQ